VLQKPVLKLEYKAFRAGRFDVESLYDNTLWYFVNSFVCLFKSSSHEILLSA